MKKLFKSMAAITFMAAVTAPAYSASTGTITFEGLLTDTTCDVDIGGSGPSATVTLPTVSINELTAPGQVTGRTVFNMNLSGCTVATGGPSTVATYFQPGPNVNLSTGRLINNGGTAGNNVSLQLLDAVSNTYNVINVGSTDQVDDAAYIDISGGTATLPYAVEYYAENATTPGTVTSSVVYNLMYK
ncbi:fimbrial protein [Enterobacter cloacae]|nr:type 1 fimbrial protein [Enterobacter cloacae]